MLHEQARLLKQLAHIDPRGTGELLGLAVIDREDREAIGAALEEIERLHRLIAREAKLLDDVHAQRERADEATRQRDVLLAALKRLLSVYVGPAARHGPGCRRGRDDPRPCPDDYCPLWEARAAVAGVDGLTAKGAK